MVLNSKNIKNVIDWLFHFISYTIILIILSVLFKKTIYIDSEHFIIWSIIATSIIYLLNKTVKPLLFWLTLPITGLTLGLFYPFINVFILKLVEIELKNVLTDASISLNFEFAKSDVSLFIVFN